LFADLACRNILLDGDLNPKVADFGYARVVNQASGSGKTAATVGPIKWMAPEAIGEQLYSEATDVWAFGCVLLELVSGREPFAGMPLVDVAVNVRDTKKHAEIPADTAPWLKELMQQCWRPQPKDRPHFSGIVEYLDQHKPGKTKKHHRSADDSSS
jgi:serine/threonine protein kinase